MKILSVDAGPLRRIARREIPATRGRAASTREQTVVVLESSKSEGIPIMRWGAPSDYQSGLIAWAGSGRESEASVGAQRLP